MLVQTHLLKEVLKILDKSLLLKQYASGYWGHKHQKYFDTPALYVVVTLTTMLQQRFHFFGYEDD